MNLNKLFLLLVALLSPMIVSANPDIEQWQTKQGARVYFVEAPELPMVDIKIAFDAGSARDENSPGIALFTNSMRDSPVSPGPIWRPFHLGA